MTHIAHLTDLHFGRIDPAVVRALRDELWDQRPDLILISGDFTQRAKQSEFVAAKAFVDDLPVRPLMVPGNHDIPLYNLWSRMLRPLHRFRRILENDLYPVQRAHSVLAMGVNSARRISAPLDWSQGRVSGRQLAEIARRFTDRREEELCVLVTHHPFIHPPAGMSLPLVRQPADTLARLAKAGVDLILAGHFHLNHSDVIATRHPEVPGIVVAQGGSATSTRLRGEPNAYNRISCEHSQETGWTISIRNRVWKKSHFEDTAFTHYGREGRCWSRLNS